MSTTVKRSITLDEALDRELMTRFPPGERSRFINDATKAALARVRLRELLDGMDAAAGPVDEETIEAVGRLPIPD
ncbi:MAG: hypothetical protein ACKOTZ_05720 [Chloroflexota bacterium]